MTTDVMASAWTNLAISQVRVMIWVGQVSRYHPMSQFRTDDDLFLVDSLISDTQQEGE